ncbi:DUF4159 domain-containing protein [Halocynthiibacter styelae]|uniref:DUF4159 domain-containing protein n=1 Tax=Halocynthiibacter styelae TaxID=2761955 RepID=A0A8J7LLZ8_9RHOB|nr:DUF4159 domain-containing protein [Paenihalocynthiibacter styelae]MBI1495249.1 DUF4159 domain-containing protein [Paenihalocynthiibacter styelae]
MMIFGSLGFTAPWVLLGLFALPILWILLRAVPPAPVRRIFPAVGLLLGLKDRDNQADRTPWWLLLLRMAALACVILGFAGPVLNPQDTREGNGSLLVLLDGSWAAARDWDRQQEKLATLLAEAGRNGRPVALASLTDLPREGLTFTSADNLRSQLAGITPAPFEPSPDNISEWAAGLADQDFDTFWFSDGLAYDHRNALYTALAARGAVTIFETARPLYGLEPVVTDQNLMRLTLRRLAAAGEEELHISAIGPDPSGREVALTTVTVSFETGADTAIAEFALQPELRNRITRFTIAEQATAGAVTLVGDGLRRREVALIRGADQEVPDLLDPLHYLYNALEPQTDILLGPVDDVLPANPDVMILADIADLAPLDKTAVTEWVEAGGLLLRFAGPRLAASDLSRDTEDTLMPVRLRSGGRSLGGTMSWGEPRRLLPFDDSSPFYGLTVPDDVSVTSQVVAQPGPELADRVIAALEDGTPLVTRKYLGQGQVVLFHTTANAEWSDLALSGLFLSMLERLSVASGRVQDLSAVALPGTTWHPDLVLDGYGRPVAADGFAGVDGAVLAEPTPASDLLPGIWRNGDQVIALNLLQADHVLRPAAWPVSARIESYENVQENPLAGWFFGFGLILLVLDVLATLALTGRAGLRGVGSASVIVGGIALILSLPSGANAQNTTDDSAAIIATSDVTFAYVITGDRGVDEISEAGLRGLSRVLTLRTSVEPALPVGVDPETDELAFYPFLYWPITSEQPALSNESIARLNAYMRTGGMIMFDTRDAGLAGSNGPNQRKLRDLARGLDIPALEPVPDDHVLTRSFYLLQDFPGRHRSDNIWVEAAPLGEEATEGMPFRNLNDGVTPVIIGGNDWAAAWAVNARGQYMLPVGRGNAGRLQREMALRFGVNLIMHVLTGNYKSDQVHVPELLERLGN